MTTKLICTTGREYSFDARDAAYLLERPRRRSRLTERYWRDDRVCLDQGDVPACVGYAWAHWLAADPIAQFADPVGLYELGKHFDEWEGTWYDGTSVRGVAKAVRLWGCLESYKWIRALDDLIWFVLERSPVVFGSDYYEGMEYPAADGIMSLEGELLGGHAALLSGVDVQRRRFRYRNSRGLAWGAAGYGWLPFYAVEQLLADDGEACAGIERQPPRN
jgi:hypothetical protein